jgi:hypothetical protein
VDLDVVHSLRGPFMEPSRSKKQSMLPPPSDDVRLKISLACASRC